MALCTHPAINTETSRCMVCGSKMKMPVDNSDHDLYANQYGIGGAAAITKEAHPIEAHSMGELLHNRGREYGDFRTQGEIAQTLKNVVREFDGWAKMAPHQREAIDMILHKISRIINGNPNFADSWVDIAGYAQITADRCPKPQPPNLPQPKL